MVVGEDIAIGADDHTRAQVGNLAWLGIKTLAKKIAEHRVVDSRMFGATNLLLGEHVDHRRNHALRSGRKRIAGIGRRVGRQWHMLNRQFVFALPLKQPGFEQCKHK